MTVSHQNDQTQNALVNAAMSNYYQRLYVIVTLMHPAKAVVRKEVPFDSDTCVVPSNTVRRGLGPPREGRFGGLNPQFAAMPLIVELLQPLVLYCYHFVVINKVDIDDAIAVLYTEVQSLLSAIETAGQPYNSDKTLYKRTDRRDKSVVRKRRPMPGFRNEGSTSDYYSEDNRRFAVAKTLLFCSRSNERFPG